MGLRLGLRVSTAAPPPDTARRRYGFIVGREPGGERRWLVRFDDDAQDSPVDAAALNPEALDEVQGMASFNPGELPAGELHEARFLPEPPERAESLFEFDTQKFDFRRWFLEDIVRPAALTQCLTALALPVECKAPGPFGAEPAPEKEIDEAGRLLSNLHRTSAAGQRAAEIGAIPAPEPASDAATGVAIPLTALEAATARQAGSVKAAQGQNRVRPSHTCFHRMYGNTMRATAKSDGVEMAARRERFEVLLRRFVREVVAPRIGCGDRPDDVSYQASPTLRISYPSGKPMGHLHCDYEYHHQPCELNFWLPLTEVWGGNTLYAESAPGLADYRPFELGWGQCVRFWGNQVRHFAVPNDSGYTRVSLDLRCLDRRRFSPVFVDRSGNFKGNRNKFNLDQYYASGRIPPPPPPPPTEPAKLETQQGSAGAEVEESGVGLGEMFGGAAVDDY